MKATIWVRRRGQATLEIAEGGKVYLRATARTIGIAWLAATAIVRPEGIEAAGGGQSRTAARKPKTSALLIEKIRASALPSKEAARYFGVHVSTVYRARSSSWRSR